MISFEQEQTARRIDSLVQMHESTIRNQMHTTMELNTQLLYQINNLIYSFQMLLKETQKQC